MNNGHIKIRWGGVLKVAFSIMLFLWKIYSPHGGNLNEARLAD